MAKIGSQKIICSNKKAFRNFSILEKFEAGIALVGTEVKALREGRGSLNEAYARIQGNEIFVENFHISPYSHGNVHNHDPLRPRKLLLHKRQLEKLYGKKHREEAEYAIVKRGIKIIPLFFAAWVNNAAHSRT